MADATRNLGLPLIAAAQAQKHVTHNEALTALDALVQLACLDKDLSAPPADPAEGDRYLVTVPNPTGAWAGLSGQMVRFQDGVWVGATAGAGWLAYVIDEADLYSFTGTAWVGFRAGLTTLQNLVRLGVGTAADATNRLSVKSEAALFSWDDVTPGSGDMRITLNKRAAANDAGFTFQTAFSTRALFGTLGSDAFDLKVSPDGSTFHSALTASASTGKVSFGVGLDAPAIGSANPGTGAFTSLTVDGAATLSPAGSGTVIIAPATIGAIDNMSIGSTIAATGRFSRLGIVAASADPAASGAALGQLAVNSTQTAIKWYDGSAWARINNFAKAAAYTNFDNYVAAGTWTKVQFNDTDSNDQGAFVAASNRFVAPEAGLYGFVVALGFKKNGTNDPTAMELQLYRNGAAAGRGRASATGTLVDGVTALALSSMLKLAINDYVEVFVRFTTTDGYVAAADSFFGAQQLA